jgi:hypothetical protein
VGRILKYEAEQSAQHGSAADSQRGKQNYFHKILRLKA